MMRLFSHLCAFAVEKTARTQRREELAEKWEVFRAAPRCGGLRPDGALIGLAEPPLQDGNRHAQKDGITEQAKRPDSQAHERFVQGRRILDHFTQGRGYKSWHHEAHALLNPDANNRQATRQVQPSESSA
jgi:hypothetical protein